MQVTKITPRGACHGVVTAIKMLTEAIGDPTIPRPIYVLGMIVHNDYYTDAFNYHNVITLSDPTKTREQLLDIIEYGTVVFTAHGVSESVRTKAKAKGLHIIDSSCIDVLHTHKLLEKQIEQGYEIIYIGKKGHPEPEGAIGVNPDKIHLVSSLDSIGKLNLTTDKIFISNQTTLSLWDVAKIANAIKDKYPSAIFQKEICNSSQIRQEAIADVKDIDLVVVVGDKQSNNTRKLAEVSETIANIPAIRVIDVFEIDTKYLIDNNIRSVAVTSGASTPTKVTQQVIKYLENFDHNNEMTWQMPEKLTPNEILPKIR